MSFVLEATVALFVLAATTATANTHAVTQFVTPDQLKWTEFREKGWAPGSATAIVAGDPNKRCGWIMRYRMPDGYSVPMHKNDDVEAATVLAGVYVMGIGKNADRARAQKYPTGSYIQVDRGVAHYGWALGETILEIRPTCDGK